MRSFYMTVHILPFKNLFYRQCRARSACTYILSFVFVNPLPDMPILGSSNSAANKKIYDKKYGQMGIKLSDWVENIVGKGKIACYKQFLLFPTMFPKTVLLMRQNKYLWSKGLMKPHPVINNLDSGINMNAT